MPLVATGIDGVMTACACSKTHITSLNQQAAKGTLLELCQPHWRDLCVKSNCVVCSDLPYHTHLCRLLFGLLLGCRCSCNPGWRRASVFSCDINACDPGYNVSPSCKVGRGCSLGEPGSPGEMPFEPVVLVAHKSWILWRISLFVGASPGTMVKSAHS